MALLKNKGNYMNLTAAFPFIYIYVYALLLLT